MPDARRARRHAGVARASCRAGAARECRARIVPRGRRARVPRAHRESNTDSWNHNSTELSAGDQEFGDQCKISDLVE